MSITGRLRWLRERVERRGTGAESVDALVMEVLGVVQDNRQCGKQVYGKLESLERLVGDWVREDLMARVERVDARVTRLYGLIGLDEDGFLVEGD